MWVLPVPGFLGFRSFVVGGMLSLILLGFGVADGLGGYYDGLRFGVVLLGVALRSSWVLLELALWVGG